MTLRPTDPRVLKRDLSDLVENVRAALAQLLDALRDRADTIDGRLDKLELQANRALVVQTLPASAAAGKWLITPSDPVNVYIGAGAGNPLRKIPTQLL